MVRGGIGPMRGSPIAAYKAIDANVAPIPTAATKPSSAIRRTAADRDVMTTDGRFRCGVRIDGKGTSCDHSWRRTLGVK